MISYRHFGKDSVSWNCGLFLLFVHIADKFAAVTGAKRPNPLRTSAYLRTSDQFATVTGAKRPNPLRTSAYPQNFWPIRGRNWSEATQSSKNFWPIRGRNWSEATQSSKNFRPIRDPITYHITPACTEPRSKKTPFFVFRPYFFLNHTKKLFFWNHNQVVFTTQWPLHHHSPPTTSSSLITSTLFTTMSVTISNLFVWRPV